ncbi:MAG: hypothetical protein H3C69_06670 [Candidatus Promineofilum sp.]|nr:hypothetical protein [Promineifilum sp.]
MNDDETLKLVESLQQEVAYLRGRVNTLESNQQLNQIEGLPNTWLLSHSYLKRAFGVYGLSLVAGLIISIPFLCLYALLILALAVSGNLP